MNHKTLLDKDYNLLHKTERRILREEILDPEQNYRLFEAMVAFARDTGVFPSKDPLEGLQQKIEFVKRLQCVSRANFKDCK